MINSLMRRFPTSKREGGEDRHVVVAGGIVDSMPPSFEAVNEYRVVVVQMKQLNSLRRVVLFKISSNAAEPACGFANH